jgi:phage I-like protein
MKSQPIPFVAGQTEIWCQLCPFGEFPVRVSLPDGSTKEIVQICDIAAFNKLLSTFTPEKLIDFEHRSDSPAIDSDTTASGWIQELKIDPENGLMCLNKLTDLGAADLANRRRRFLSPVWLLDADGRPCELRKAALTNTPNIRAMRPVLNKSPAEAAGQPKERNPAMDITTIALALGLPETATAEEVTAAAKTAKAAADKSAALEARVAELEKQQLGSEADQVCAENKGRIGDPVKFKALYVSNKAFALAALETMPKPTIANKADAQTPPASGAVASNKDTDRRAAIESIRKERGCSYVDAEAAAQVRNPELFA